MLIGFGHYTNEWNGELPGSTMDVEGETWPPYPEGRKTLCWLGSWSGWGDRFHIPYCGTLYPYVSRQEKIYRCPSDQLNSRERPNVQGLPPWRDMPYYSYTSPILLTGAPASLLKRSRWLDLYRHGWVWDKRWDWATHTSQPWIVVEEDPANKLLEAPDGAWTNLDQVAKRHGGRGTIGFLDGSTMVRKFEAGKYHPFDAWRLYYELTDGRIVSAGPCGKRMGYLRYEAPGLNQ